MRICASLGSLPSSISPGTLLYVYLSSRGSNNVKLDNSYVTLKNRHLLHAPLRTHTFGGP